MKLQLVTAIILRDEHMRDNIFHGHLVILYSDGTIWERTEFTDRDGMVKFSEGRRRMTLDVLKEEFKKDLEGMGQRFRTMWFLRGEGYQVVSPVMLETLKGFVVESKSVGKTQRRKYVKKSR